MEYKISKPYEDKLEEKITCVECCFFQGYYDGYCTNHREKRTAEDWCDSGER